MVSMKFTFCVSLRLVMQLQFETVTVILHQVEMFKQIFFISWELAGPMIQLYCE